MKIVHIFNRLYIPCYIFSSSVLFHKQKSIEKGSSAYDLEPSPLATKGTLNVSKVNWKHVIFFPFVRWFWSIVQKMTPLQRQQLLYFCTGSAVLPALSDRRDPDQGIVFILFIVIEKINILLLLLYSFVALFNKCSFRLYNLKGGVTVVVQVLFSFVSFWERHG